MARGLNVEQITEAAVAIADEQGLAAVSMATVAKRCGFTTMSLYRHVASKDELVWRMVDWALGPAPPLTFDGWRDGLAQWAQALMDRLREHPWAIDIPINGTLPTYAQLSWLNRGLEVMDGTGLDRRRGRRPRAAAQRLRVLGAAPGGGFDDRSAAAARPAATRPERPAVPAARVEDRQFEDDSTPDENFRLGLNRTLDGIAASIP